MKRSLVSYSSSDEGESEPPSKRKLPALSSSLVSPGPVDNPALHQGRIRTTPHRDGQFAAYIYVSVPLVLNSHLDKLIVKVLRAAKLQVPILHTIGWIEATDVDEKGDLQDGGTNCSITKRSRELHISLSRPVYLRAHQWEDLKRTVKNIATTHPPFTASFAAFSELTNDERSRTFLAMDVGAGYSEFRALSNALDPILRSIRQNGFYPNPRFHASIAWALLARPCDASLNTINPESDSHDSPHSTPSPDTVEVLPASAILHLPSSLVTTLNKEYGPRLASQHVGTFEVTRIAMKIGKDIHSWILTGSPVLH